MRIAAALLPAILILLLANPATASVPVEPVMVTFQNTQTFAGRIITVAGNFSIVPAASLTGTVSITVVNATTGEIILQKLITVQVSIDGVNSSAVPARMLVPEAGLALSFTITLPVGSVSVSVTKSPDFNGDGAITIIDVAIVAHAFDTVAGDSRFSEPGDLNADGRVDITDVATSALWFDFRQQA